LPAIGVSWAEAEAACEHFGGRLPTEAEWEYAARAGSQTAWSFGNDEKMLGEYAWFGESLDKAPHPIGMKKSNAWGLYDMHGNVGEWIADWYAPYTSGSQINPTGPRAGKARVLRGGAFFDPPGVLRSVDRNSFPRAGRSWGVGFRCVHGPRRQP
jgi:formylglycine-generating enzyme required for sulfatase activity